MQDRKLGIVSGVVRSAQLYPWRTVEHCTLILLVLYLVSGRACHHLASSNPTSVCPAGQRRCCCASDEAGPLSALTADGVSEAPLPTMSVADLKPGSTVEHHDFRGDIYRFPMGDGIILNLMKTEAGTLRSGDLHNCTQFDVVLDGRTRLHTFDTVTGRETAVVYGRNDFIKIPARVPHLFEFLETNYMVEWWDCDFQAWYFRPYRDRIAASFTASQAALQRRTAAKSAVDNAGSNGAGSFKDGNKQPGNAASAFMQTQQQQQQQQPLEAHAQAESRAAAARRQRDRAGSAQQHRQESPKQQGGVRGARVSDPVADATGVDGRGKGSSSKDGGDAGNGDGSAAIPQAEAASGSTPADASSATQGATGQGSGGHAADSRTDSSVGSTGSVSQDAGQLQSGGASAQEQGDSRREGGAASGRGDTAGRGRQQDVGGATAAAEPQHVQPGQGSAADGEESAVEELDYDDAQRQQENA